MNVTSLQWLFGVLAISVGLTGAIADVRTRLIPNWLTGPAMLAGLLLHLEAGGCGEMARSLVAMLLCGGVFFVFHLAGGMGAGDVKLVAALAAVLGLPGAASLLVFTALSGGVMGVALAISHGKLRETVTNVLVLTAHHSRRGLQPHPELNVTNQRTLRLPYGVAIAAGCLLTVILPRIAGVAP